MSGGSEQVSDDDPTIAQASKVRGLLSETGGPCLKKRCRRQSMRATGLAVGTVAKASGRGQRGREMGCQERRAKEREKQAVVSCSVGVTNQGGEMASYEKRPRGGWNGGMGTLPLTLPAQGSNCCRSILACPLDA